VPVRAITNDELVKIRGEGQYSEVFIIPRIPNVIYTARLDGLPATAERFPHDMIGQIEFTSGSGTLSDVLPDMTIWVGTTAGGWDLGICRVRKAPISGTFYIGELSHIEWVDNCHLTVVDDFDILPRHLKIVDGDFLVDYDIPYTDQYSDFEPVCNMGGHVVLEWHGEAVSIQRSASASWVFGSTISSYAWTAPGASSTSGMTTATPTITYNTPGYYRIYCVVTAANGKTFRGVRYVFVVNPDELEQVHAARISESTDGSTFDVSMTNAGSLPPRAFCILFARDYYQGDRESIGFNAGEQNVLAVGRIIDSSMTFNDESSVASFQVANWQHWLKQIHGFPAGLRMAQNTPAEWVDMPALNVDRAVFYLLRYHSTVTRISDFYRSNNTLYASELASIAGSLWSQLEEIAATSIHAYLIYDRFGYGYLRKESQLVPESSRSGWAVVQEITSDDWQGELSVELREFTDTSQITSSGVFVPLNGSSAPRFSLSPGHVPFPYGNPDEMERLLLGSQAQANSVAGLMMGWANRMFEELSIVFVGNNRMFSVAQYCRAEIEITADDNALGVEYDGYIIPRSIEIEWESGSGHMFTTVRFEDESLEDLSTDGDPPVESGIEPLPSIPPPPKIIIPPFPPPILPPAVINNNHPKFGWIHTANFGFAWTDKFAEEGNLVQWQFMNNGLTENERLQVANMVRTPSGALYAICEGGDGVGWNKVIRAEGLGGTWSVVFDAISVDPDLAISAIGVNPLSNDSVAIMVGKNYVSFGTLDTHNIYVGEGGSFTQGDLCQLKFNHTLKSIVFFQGGWHVFGHRPSGIGGSSAQPRMWRYTPDGTLDLIDVDGEPWGISVASTTGTIGASAAGSHILCWGGNSDGYTLINDVEGLDQSHITDQITLQAGKIQAAALSPVGVNALAHSAEFLNPPYRSTDGGATWQVNTGTVPVGSTVWETCGDANRFLFGGGQVLRYTGDLGSTYHEKHGNLGYIAPLYNIDLIRYVG
jgi:hypothetical protein